LRFLALLADPGGSQELALATPKLKQLRAEIPRLGCAAQRGRREFKNGVVRYARFVFEYPHPNPLPQAGEGEHQRF
jgi:hypothetical protein